MQHAEGDAGFRFTTKAFQSAEFPTHSSGDPRTRSRAPRSPIQRTMHPTRCRRRHMRVNHRRFQTIVTEQLLNTANVHSILHQVSRVTVSQRVTGSLLVDTRHLGHLFHDRVERVFVQMMPPPQTRARVVHQPLGRKKPLPRKLLASMGRTSPSRHRAETRPAIRPADPPRANICTSTRSPAFDNIAESFPSGTTTSPTPFPPSLSPASPPAGAPRLRLRSLITLPGIPILIIHNEPVKPTTTG